MTEVPANNAAMLAGLAARIRFTGKRILADVIEIGRDLRRAKDLMPRGNWLPWLQKELALGERSAQRFMQIADLANTTDLSGLPDLSMYAVHMLATTPAPVRKQLIERAKATGGKITGAEVRAARASYGVVMEPTTTVPFTIEHEPLLPESLPFTQLPPPLVSEGDPEIGVAAARARMSARNMQKVAEEVTRAMQECRDAAEVTRKFEQFLRINTNVKITPAHDRPRLFAELRAVIDRVEANLASKH